MQTEVRRKIDSATKLIFEKYAGIIRTLDDHERDLYKSTVHEALESSDGRITREEAHQLGMMSVQLESYDLSVFNENYEANEKLDEINRKKRADYLNKWTEVRKLKRHEKTEFVLSQEIVKKDGEAKAD